MKLWLISQDNNQAYDTYDAAVVAAETEDDARNTHPSGAEFDRLYMWCSPEFVRVRLLSENYDGEAGVILASFNAG